MKIKEQTGKRASHKKQNGLEFGLFYKLFKIGQFLAYTLIEFELKHT